MFWSYLAITDPRACWEVVIAVTIVGTARTVRWAEPAKGQADTKAVEHARGRRAA